MTKFYDSNLSMQVDAVQFDPASGTWPACVIPWGEVQPKDMSWGYIDSAGGKIHVLANDWIISRGIPGEFSTCKDEEFRSTYNLAKKPLLDLSVRLAMVDLLKALNKAKPNDRSAKDRRVALAITKAEELIAIYCFWGQADPEGAILENRPSG